MHFVKMKANKVNGGKFIVGEYQDKFGERIIIVSEYRHFIDNEIYYVIERKRQRFVISKKEFKHYFQPIKSDLSTSEKIKLYLSIFKGRRDVYAKSFINESGKIQYYPSYCYGWKYLRPEERKCEPLTEKVIKEHLMGERHIGIFPILHNETCFFLAIDLDKKDWRQAVTALREVCKRKKIIPNIEISRSGNGAHIWFFFSDPVSCQKAREFGKNLLKLTMQESSIMSFESFDRFFPNQDFLPKGGFGNLIALPLNGKNYFEQRTVFIDDNFDPYPDQWQYLQNVQKIDQKLLDEILKVKVVSNDNFIERIKAVFSNEIIFNKEHLPAKIVYQLKRLASFANQEFYIKQASRQSTYLTPERIYLYRETPQELAIPRGLVDDVRELLPNLDLQDRRVEHRHLKISFKGNLYVEQEIALQSLMNFEQGILSARTGFGKTILAADLISNKKCRTLILVHNSQLLEQWYDNLNRYLEFEEEKVYRYTPTGQRKEIGYVGQYGSGKKWTTQMVDIAMIQSLFKLEDLGSFLENYEMMIVDECHHVTARMFEKVVAQFQGKYMYGLTATPTRKNGHEPILFQRIGPIRYETTQEEIENFTRNLYLRFTNFGKLDPTIVQSQSFIELNKKLAQDNSRNQQILSDIEHASTRNRKIVVICNRHEQILVLEELLSKSMINNYFVITGKTKKKERKRKLEKIAKLPEEEPFILLSTGKFIGEGFDLPQLDTLFIAAPLSWKNNLVQYAGRIHRECPRKSSVEIYDYIDFYVPYLEKMYQKRQVAYRKMNYTTALSEKQLSLYNDSNCENVFGKDIIQTKGSIIFATDYIKRSELYYLSEKYFNKYFIVYCQDTVSYQKLAQKFKGTNVEFVLVDRKFGNSVVILDDIVWYGKLPIFARGEEAKSSSILRLESSALVTEFKDLWLDDEEKS